jgi:hypothetical protein
MKNTMSDNQQENLWRLLWEYDPNGLILPFARCLKSIKKTLLVNPFQIF